ncbi:MAG TPA: aldo/keto reductase [Candidatus Saccharimonadales bacterium]
MTLKTVSGKDLNPIGIGTWDVNSKRNPDNLSSKYGGVDPVKGNEDKAIEAIRYSISKGQNNIDCAELYGSFYTDEVVGQAIEGQSRNDIFIGDKLWKTSLANGTVRPTFDNMLQKLKTDYLDMLTIHAPFADTPWQEAIPQIDELINEGVVHHFGVSNFSIEQMKEAMSLSRHPLEANQMNFNLLYRDEVNQEFVDFCEENNIAIIAYQPIKRGEVMHNETIIKIAQQHSATPAQVALAWLLRLEAMPIPKALSKEHIDENFEALNLKLTDEEFAELNAI